MQVSCLFVAFAQLFAQMPDFRWRLQRGASRPPGWGGRYRILPISLRISSLAAILIYGLFLSFLLQKAAVFAIWPQSWSSIGLWITTGYRTLGLPLNAMSQSRVERLVVTPVAAILAILLLIVALS